MKQSLQKRIIKYLKNKQGWVNGGDIERKALDIGYKASNASRRLRILVEASNGLKTTSEHVTAQKILGEGKIEKKDEKSVWYRYTPSKYELIHAKMRHTEPKTPNTIKDTSPYNHERALAFFNH